MATVSVHGVCVHEVLDRDRLRARRVASGLEAVIDGEARRAVRGVFCRVLARVLVTSWPRGLGAG